MQAVEQHTLKVQKQQDAAKAAASFQVAQHPCTAHTAHTSMCH